MTAADAAHAVAGEPGPEVSVVPGGEEREARLGLVCVSEPADLDLYRLVAREGAPAVWRSLDGVRASTSWGRRRVGVCLPEMYAAMDAHRIRFLVPGDDEWPDGLDDLETAEPVNGHGGAPLGLFVSGPGRLDEWARRAVALVGSRASTPYGESVAAELGADLAASGHTVISGGAYGIDACAHRGALAAGGRTICAQASGLDTPYPRGNSSLFRAMADEQLLVSEIPPLGHPTRTRFLGRNRLIAALAGATVIVEAGVRSGARNTVSWATSLGRPVLAIPGPVHSALSITPHRLIRDAEATLVSSADEIREVMAPMGQELLPFVRGGERVLDGLDEVTRQVFEAVPGRGGLGAGELAVRCGTSLTATLTALSVLEERGLAQRLEGGGWRLVPGAVG